MDQVLDADKASKFTSGDVIGSMPEIVTTNILNRMPIREAVRTGILSRNWRFKWTLLTQLVFDEEFFRSFLGPKGECRYEKDIISRLLLSFRGPITKFVLYIPYYKALDVRDISHWVMFLSGKGIEEFTLISLFFAKLVKLPTHLFSCQTLRYLKLRNCCIGAAPTFDGLPNLLSLDLHGVEFSSGNFGEVITRCRLLETLKLISDYNKSTKTKLVEFAQLENLKHLSLQLRIVDSTGITSSIIFQLGRCLPKLQELYLDFRNYEFLEDVIARKWVCNAFPNLTTLTLYPIDFSNGSMVLCTFEMIWGSPNLETLIITATNQKNLLPVLPISSEVDYNTMGKLKLQSVVFSSFRGFEKEECLIKYLLACSPLLKKMSIHFNSRSSPVSDGKLMFAKKLLMFRRASPNAEVELT